MLRASQTLEEAPSAGFHSEIWLRQVGYLHNCVTETCNEGATERLA